MDLTLAPIAEACKFVGSQAELARQLNVTPSLVNQWLKNERPIPDRTCAVVERITEGRVRVERLNENTIWVRVPDPEWPHPEGRPCIDAANSTPRKEAA